MIQPISSNGILQSRKQVVKTQSQNVNVDSPRFGSGNSPVNAAMQFYRAVSDGDIAAVQGFIMGPVARGELSINTRDDSRMTVIQEAIVTRHKDVMDMLLEAGANPNKVDRNGFSALHHAVNSGSYPMLSALLEKGALLNVKSYRKWTPLHHAASLGYENMAKALLNKGANPNIRDKEHLTPFQVAVERRNYPVAKKILQHIGKYPDGLKTEEEEQAFLRAMSAKSDPWYFRALTALENKIFGASD